MIICPLSSGSKGNSTFIQSDKRRILIDNGLSAKKLQARLEAIDVQIDTISALFITHEHSDHIGGAGVLARKHKIPVYLKEPTFFKKQKNIFKGTEKIIFIQSGDIVLDDMTIKAIPVSHDAADPVCYTVESNDRKVAVVTDMGMATKLVKFHVNNCDALLLEMNHDEALLKRNPKYPWPLKQRILSNVGHLSNADGAQLFRDVVTERTKHIFLSHLSEENNDPNLAKDTLQKLTEDHPFYERSKIQVAEQYSTSNFVDLAKD